MTKICLVAHNAFGAICHDATKHIGGVETQTALLARWLSAKNYDVSVITWDEGAPVDGQSPQHLRLITVCRRDAGVPGLRFLYPRWTSLIGALNEANADIYYHSGAEYVTGQVAQWCRLWHRKFVFSVASDMDCASDLPLLRTLRERVLYRRGLKLADLVIAQTRSQKKLLTENFNVEVQMLPMACKLSSDELLGHDACRTGDRPLILMVCRIARVKNVEMLLHVAKILAECDFTLVGPADCDLEYLNMLEETISGLPNIQWHGAANKEKLLEFYGRATFLCCTSLWEGFPNTFIEAWANSLPVISTVDPDGVIKENTLGVHVSDEKEMAVAIRRIVQSDLELNALRESCNAYYLRVHEPSIALQRYDEAFQRLL